MLTRRVVLVVAGTLVVGGAIVPFLLGRGSAGASRRIADEMGQGPARATGEIRSDRSFEYPDGVVEWTVRSYESEDGTCMAARAVTLDASDDGEIGGCGEPADPLLWSLGGVEVGGQWYNVSFGRLPPNASSARLTLGDGSVLTDSGDGGLWVVVTAAEPDDPDALISIIEAVDGSGDAVARLHPSTDDLLDRRTQAQAQAVETAS